MIKENIKIIPIEYGKSVLSEKNIFQNGSDNKFKNIVFKIFLIITQNRKVLIDAGCETMPGFDMKDFVGPVKALEKIGLKPCDISDLIITHAHHDHIEAVKYFTCANIFIQKDEYNAGKEYFSNKHKIITFENEICLLPNIKIIKIGGHSIGSSIVEISDKNIINVIVGDEIYSKECILKNIPTGASYNLENSLAFINKYSDNKYNLLLCHDN